MSELDWLEYDSSNEDEDCWSETLDGCAFLGHHDNEQQPEEEYNANALRPGEPATVLDPRD